MPEIAEVYRAARILRKAALGKRIVRVDTIEDDLVFVGGATKFRKHVEGANVETVERYGKHFYMTLSNQISVVFHLGMSGYVHIKGEPPVAYRRKPKDPSLWPPKYWRFVLTLDDEEQFAFMDSRRFGRIKVLETSTPKLESPLKDLGYDAICNMATLEQFTAVTRKRKCPVKALLLNQKFLAGVGNWVADEILYQSKVHPAQVANTLSDDQIQRLYDNTIEVCNFAVSVDADHDKFPAHWLFKYRWGKSHAVRKRKGADSDEDDSDDMDGSKEVQPLGKTMIRADGKELNIQWITCGGRTSAFVVDEQILPVSTDEAVESPAAVSGKPISTVKMEVEESPARSRKKRVVAKRGQAVHVEEKEEEDEEHSIIPVTKVAKKVKKVMKIKFEGIETAEASETPPAGRRTSSRLRKVV